MARKPTSQESMSDKAVIERMLAILVNAAEGRRSIGDDAQYPELRKQFRRRSIQMPSLVSTHPSIDSFMSVMRQTKDRKDRVQRITDEFGPLLLSTLPEHQAHAIPSSDWTGQSDRIAQLRVVRELLPVARSTIEALIDALSQPGPNGGPLLDEREEAIKHLRELHTTLGQLLGEIDGGRFDDDLGQGLAAGAFRLARTIRDNLRAEPLPCAVAGLVLGICTLTGHPGAGAFLSDATYRLSTKRTASTH